MLPAAVRDWLIRSSAELFAESGDGLEIDVRKIYRRPQATVYLCRCRWPSREIDICVKSFLDSEAAEFHALCRRAELVTADIVDRGVDFPRILGHDFELATIVMDWVEGEPLERRILRSFVQGAEARRQCRALLERTAGALATLHGINVESGLPRAAPCSNREYVQRLQETATSEFVNECLELGGASKDRVLASLPAEFWDREERRLLHGDCQPKNVLVDSNGRLAFIDLDYGLGHPLRDVAHFVVQLERLLRRWPLPGTRRLLESYARAFLAAYSKQGLGYLMEDLPFFRLWALSFSLREDERHAWPLRLYIKWAQGADELREH